MEYCVNSWGRSRGVGGVWVGVIVIFSNAAGTSLYQARLFCRFSDSYIKISR